MVDEIKKKLFVQYLSKKETTITKNFKFTRIATLFFLIFLHVFQNSSRFLKVYIF